MLLVSLNISCSLRQSCRSFFGLAVTEITTKKIIVPGVAGQGPTSPEVCGGKEVQRWGGNIIPLEQVTDQGSQLGQGNAVGSHPSSAGASSSCTSIFSSLGRLCTCLPFPSQTPVSPVSSPAGQAPSACNLFIVLRPPQNFSSFSVLEFFFEVFAGTGCQRHK